MSSSTLYELPQIFYRHGRILFSMYHSMTIRTNRYYILKCVFNKLTYILLFVSKNRFLVMDLDVSSSALAVCFIKIKRAHRTLYMAVNRVKFYGSFAQLPSSLIYFDFF